MKHNLILGWICCGLSGFMTAFEVICGGRDFACAVILTVAGLYFAGRHMDRHHD